MDAQTYYQSLIDQGYTAEQAQQFTAQHFPGFIAAAPAAVPMAPAAPVAPAFAEPEAQMPAPTQGADFVQTESDGSKNGNMVKTLSIVIVTLLIVVGGTVGALHTFGVLGSDEKSPLVGEWFNSDGNSIYWNEDGSIEWGDWGSDQRSSGYSKAEWSTSGDELTYSLERTASGESGDYNQITTGVMKYEIVKGVKFVHLEEVTQTNEEGGEDDLMDLYSDEEKCQASIRKSSIQFEEENWNGVAYSQWVQIVNSVEKPSWCDAEFVDEYEFSFTNDSDNAVFALTLEHTKYDKLHMYEDEIWISVAGSESHQCMEDEYQSFCYWLRDYDSDNGNSDWDVGDTLQFYKGQGWDVDCSSGCDLEIRVLQSLPDGLKLQVAILNETITIAN